MSEPFAVQETPNARKVIEDHQKPMLIDFLTRHEASEILLLDAAAVEQAYGGKNGKINVVCVDADKKDNKDLLKKFHVTETEEASALPTVVVTNDKGEVVVDAKGKMIGRQIGVYRPDMKNPENDENPITIENIATALTTVMPGTSKETIIDDISAGGDRLSIQLGYPLPKFKFDK